MTDIISELNEMFEEALKESEERSLGEILTHSREEKNLKLVDIARITGLSESLIGKLESNQLNDIKISTMKKLSIAYDLPINVFVSHLGRDPELDQMVEKLSKLSSARSLLKK